MSPSPSTDAANPNSPLLRDPTSPASVPTSALFLQPQPVETPPSPSLPSPSSPPRTEATDPTPPDPRDAAPEPSWSAGSEDRASAPDPQGSSAPRSTGDSKVAITAAGIAAALGTALKTVTNAVAVIAADTVEQQYGLWRVDQDDIDAIAPPAARIIYRRVPAEAKDTDALDYLSIAFGVAAYLTKHLRRKADLKAYQHQLVDQLGTQTQEA